MIEEIWDGASLTSEQRAHLSDCEECQHKLTALMLLHDEFEVARLSHVDPESVSRLYSIFAQAGRVAQSESPFRNLLDTVTAWVIALPLWDSRRQLGAVGIRNATSQSYRLLFGANEIEVELMVEPQNGLLRVTGEVMIGDSLSGDGVAGDMMTTEAPAGSTLALVELMTAANSKMAIETESDATGRFALEQVPPGTYVMTITPRFHEVVVIDPLELT